MEEYILHPYLKRESEILQKDRECEACRWMMIGKASLAIADVLNMDELMPWQVQGLKHAQVCLAEDARIIDLLVSDKLLIKKEVSDDNVWFAAYTGLF